MYINNKETAVVVMNVRRIRNVFVYLTPFFKCSLSHPCEKLLQLVTTFILSFDIVHFVRVFLLLFTVNIVRLSNVLRRNNGITNSFQLA